ncbi:MAG: hypothetical protein COU11_02005 [Candidatus Harrisonbacteria bacterium CG10_big_fil_rev_8_21_14_0_10_49_15]|uniref:RNA polymerase sigma factor 70 region 4 type 2 domain-containing protein n=1 Tax=Candidatus Harrisonbacteria bacterium CG10_big_fil_rev_8_21_14_0_10_49_15 TaxID=1974587 RepID=A0A2H0UL82_9BACT|nr:MAG: hypothetical protein COU11_02005 [Candidatus Harrisonbacteria bacterium CG10_big_fil_rev_8_21_14_0_10_49_15]
MRPKPGAALKSNPASATKFLEQIDEALAEALASLNPVYRVPFLLFALEGHSYKQISELLSVPLGTVTSRIGRARERLKKSICPPR